MPLLDLTLPSGIYGNGTALQARGRWRDGHAVRFAEKTVRPIGGWRAHSPSAVVGKARAVLAWKDNLNGAWIGVGTHNRLYAMTHSGALHDITPAGLTAGVADATLAAGYGVGRWGGAAYGTPRLDDASIQDATVWSLDTRGENLVGCNAEDGKLYEWSLNPVAPATVIANSPTARALVMTNERILMALGADGNPRMVKWSDQEDDTQWSPDPTNQAGFFALQTAGRLMCGRRLSGETGLWTDVDFWTAGYTGDALVYSFSRKGSGCGAISQQAVAPIDSQAVWMSQNGFWTYNGFVQPLACEVHDRVFSDLNRVQASKVHAVHNSGFGEVWWFYPSAASNEIDRYVAWSYREGCWTVGVLSRLSGADRGVLAYPLMMGDDGLAYEHETGWSYPGAASPFLVSGPVQLGVGDQVAYATRLIADEKTQGDVRVSFETRFYPNGAASGVGPFGLAAAPTDLRFSGRQIEMRIEGVRSADWRWGSPPARIDGRGAAMSIVLPRPAALYDLDDQAQTRRRIERAFEQVAPLSALNRLASCTVAELPPASRDGMMILVTDEAGGAVPAFSSAGVWRRFTDRAPVS